MKQQIIDRHFINTSIEYYDGVTESVLFKIDDFYHAINFWKIILYEGHGMRPGMVISPFDSSIRFTYTSLFFAAAELGLVILTPPEKATDSSGRSTKLDAMLGQNHIDLVIVDSIVENSHLLAMADYYGKKTINVAEFDSYTVKDHKLYAKLSNSIYANPSDKLIVTTSSGSTGAPKLISYTHQQIYRICQRNAKIFELSNQSVCHIRNMHHSFILMVGFLPTLHVSKYHYTNAVNPDSVEHVQKFIEHIIEAKISKLAVPFKLILDSMLDVMIANNITFNHQIDITVGGFYITPDYIKKLCKTNIHSLISNFGSNETFGPIFLKTVTQATDIDMHVSTHLGDKPDDFFVTELHNNKLYVQCPELYNDTMIMGDKIDGNDQIGYLHLGRDSFYRINDIDFSTEKLNAIVAEHCTGKFDVLIDLPYQKLYVVVWDGDINFDSINQSMTNEYTDLKFDNVAKLNITDYNKSFKIDFEVIKIKFRNKEIG